MSKRKTDRTWGIERNPESDMAGKLVVGGKDMMPIIFWRSPGINVINANAEDITGAARHNQRVEIIGRTTFKGARFVKVRKMVIHDGKEYPQVGWLTASLLKREGEGQEMYG